MPVMEARPDTLFLTLLLGASFLLMATVCAYFIPTPSGKKIAVVSMALGIGLVLKPLELMLFH